MLGFKLVHLIINSLNREKAVEELHKRIAALSALHQQPHSLVMVQDPGHREVYLWWLLQVQNTCCRAQPVVFHRRYVNNLFRSRFAWFK